MNLKKASNLFYLVAGLSVILIPLIIVPLIENLTGHDVGENSSELILTIIFSLVEIGLVLNLVYNKKMHASKTTIRKNLLQCLVICYVILYNVFRHFSWMASTMEWIQITAAIFLYLSIGVLGFDDFISGSEKTIKKAIIREKGLDSDIKSFSILDILKYWK